MKPITGVFKDRIKLLIENNISLLGYHLPLDANEDLGNNAILANRIGLSNIKPFLKYKGSEIGFKGKIKKIKFEEFLSLVEKEVGPISSYVQGCENSEKIGICSGGASGDVENTINDYIDTYITGEIGEPTLAFCKEAKINYIALGHYNSETWGVEALGEMLKEKFKIPVEFVRVENPN
jgi:putative NIF3 family GTP cyclohydrolase 1 type 2